MAAVAECNHLRIELAWIVEAGRVDRYQFRHCNECEVNWRSATRTESVHLFIPAVTCDPPVFCITRKRYIGSQGESQIGSMPSATSFLAIAALAVILEDGFAARIIADRAARTSAGIGLGHSHSPDERVLNWRRKISGQFWLRENVDAATGFQEGFQAGQNDRPTFFYALRHSAVGFKFVMGNG